MHADRILAGLGPQLNLSQGLIGERAAHDEGRMTHRAAQIDEATFS